MKLFTDSNNVIIDIAEDIAIVGPFIMVYNNGQLTSYMHDGEVIYTVESIPEGVKLQTHLYDGQDFSINPNYIEPE